MAVNTRNRRASVIGHCGGYRQVWPNPDGSISALADRQHIAMLYPGIAAQSAVGSTRTLHGAAPVSRTLSGAALISRTLRGAAPVRRTLPGTSLADH